MRASTIGILSSGQSFHPDAINYFTRVEAKGGTFTSQQKAAYNTLFNTLDSNGDREEILELWDSGISYSGCDEKLIYPNTIDSFITLNNFVSGDWTLANGLAGNGNNKYATTGFNPNSHSLDRRNGFYGIYRAKAGYRTVGLTQPTNMPLGGTSTGLYVNSGLVNLTLPFTSILSSRSIIGNYSDGLQCIFTNLSGVKAYSRDVEIGSGALATSGTENQSIELFRYNSASYSRSDLTNYIIGKGTNMDAARVARISDALDTLNQSLGRVNLSAIRNIYFGDSITFGQGATTYSNCWVSLLNASLGGTEVNMGIGGSMLQNTSPVSANNGRDRYLANIVANIIDPSLTRVFILYGVNDLRYNNVAYTDAEYQTDLEYIVDDLISRGVPNENIYVGSPSYLDPSDFATTSAPFNAGSVEKQEAYVAAALDVATTRAVKYAGVYEYMLANGSTTLVGSDGTHPNNNGHIAIRDSFLAAAIP